MLRNTESSIRSIVALVVLSAALATPAQDAPSPAATRRQHHVVRDTNQNVYFELTEIVTTSEARNEKVVVLRDHGTGFGVRFIRLSEHETKKVTMRAEETNGGSFVSVQFIPPAGMSTRETADEAEKNATVEESDERSMTFATNTVRRTALASQWRHEATSRLWRTELRSSLAPPFLESLERLRELAFRSDSPLGAFGSLLHPLYHGNSLKPGAGKLLIEPASPDCRFDADMGYACSEAQVKRINDAEAAGKPLTDY